MAFFVGFAFLWRAGCFCLAASFGNRKTDISDENRLLRLAACLLAGLALRCIFAAGDVWFPYDMGMFESWAREVRETGYKNFYTGGIFVDYPPGYIYLLSLAGYAEKIFGFSERVFVFVIKLFPIISDLGLTALIYIIAKDRGKIEALLLSACFLFCPAVVYDSRVWGQCDSLLLFFVALSIYLLLEDKITFARISYALGLLIKPQALLFGPVLLFIMLEKRDFKKILLAVVTGLGTVWLLALPFSRGLSPLWIIHIYRDVIGEYGYFSYNGFNIYSLLGLNGTPLSQNPFRGIINPRVIIFLLCAGAYGYVRQKGKGKSYSYACLLITCIFAFCTMMHERYLFPAIFFALAAYIYTGSKGYFYLFVSRRVQNFLNIAVIMAGQGVYSFGFPSFFEPLLGLVAVLCGIWALSLFLRDSIKGERLFPLTEKR